MQNTVKNKITENKTKKRLNFKFVAINSIFVIFLLYAFVILVDQQMQITKQSDKLDEIEQNIAVQEDKNDEIRNVYNVLTELNDMKNIDNYKESLKYIERVAREDYDYANKGERIFVNIAGD